MIKEETRKLNLDLKCTWSYLLDRLEMSPNNPIYLNLITLIIVTTLITCLLHYKINIFGDIYIVVNRLKTRITRVPSA